MCDICSSAEELKSLTAMEMRMVVKNGFDPFATKLVDTTTINTWSEGLFDKIYYSTGTKDFTPAYKAAFQKWKKELVEVDQTRWNLCLKCHKAAWEYLGFRPPFGFLP